MFISKMKLRQRMLITIIGIIVISLGGLLTYVGISNREEALHAAHELTDISSEAIATKVEKDVASAMDIARSLANSLEAMKLAGNPNRDLASALIKNVVVNHPEFIGIWTLWEPNAFDGRDHTYAGAQKQDASGRLNIYWNQTKDGVALEFLTGYNEPGEGDYYQLAKNSGLETLINPYMYAVMGEEVMMTSTVVPILENGKVVGAVGVDLSMESLQDMVSGFSMYETGFAGIYSNNGTIIASPYSERIGKLYTDVYKDDKTTSDVVKAIKEGTELAITNENGEYRHLTPISIGKSETPWSVTVVVPEKEVTAAATTTLINTVITGLVVLVVLVTTVIILTNSIVKPIESTVDLAKTMAEGDFTQELPDQYMKRNDEIGILVKSFKEMSGSLRSMISNIMLSSQEVAAASQQISSTTEQIASGSSSQAEAAQIMQHLFNELSLAINTVAVNAEDTAEIAERTNAIARDGGQIVESSIMSMEEVSRQVGFVEKDSNRVGEIIEVIEDIANQTNLLALNAAIEAARAGDQGRGFAVVAAEVRRLAERSGTATKEITAIIKGMQANIAQSVNAVGTGVVQSRRTGEAFENIAAMIRQTESKVSEIATACEEQSAQTQDVMKSIDYIASASQEAAAASEETAATSNNLSKLAEELNNTVSSFKVV